MHPTTQCDAIDSIVSEGGRLTGIVTLDDLAALSDDAELAARLTTQTTRAAAARILLPRPRGVSELVGARVAARRRWPAP